LLPGVGHRAGPVHNRDVAADEADRFDLTLQPASMQDRLVELVSLASQCLTRGAQRRRRGCQLWVNRTRLGAVSGSGRAPGRGIHVPLKNRLIRSVSSEKAQRSVIFPSRMW
jgi:hypothetical protein